MQNVRFLAALTLILASIPAARAAEEKWSPVPKVDWTQVKPSDFSDEELDLPYYLDHFHQLANGIVESGPDRGFIRIPVWRGENATYNARVLENYASLAYFYCADRPWNVYRGSPAVRQRLEALLKFWCDQQGVNGEFSEYQPRKWGVAPTAFATKFMGRTLELLHDGPPIDSALHKRVVDADRRAIVATFTDPDFYRHGKSFTNQFANAFGGAAAYLHLYPDPEIQKLLEGVMQKAHADFQSPAGFFYEKDGPDFGYTLHTHHSDMVQAYHHLRNTDLGKLIEDEQKLWADWLSYNLLREPDASTFVTNRGVETRQKTPVWSRLESPWGQNVPEIRAFALSREELSAIVKQMRAAMEKDWGHFTPARDAGGQLTAQNARAGSGAKLNFSPYAVLDRAYYQWRPTQAQRDDAVKKLPYLARDRFTHQRVDSRNPALFTYVKRPTYYAAFNSGTHLTDQQRLGLGLIWTPADGTLLQTQTATDDAAWGTRVVGEQVEGTSDLKATIEITGKPVDPRPGNRDLDDGDLVIRYDLPHGAKKLLRFSDTGMAVEVTGSGASLTEQIPLLTKAGVQIRDNTIKNGSMLIVFDPGTVTPSLRESHTTIAGKRLTILGLAAKDALKYEIRFEPSK